MKVMFVDCDGKDIEIGDTINSANGEFNDPRTITAVRDHMSGVVVEYADNKGRKQKAIMLNSLDTWKRI